jgi:hypothetical protein
MVEIIKENDFFFLLDLPEVFLYGRLKTLRICFNSQIWEIKHVVEPGFQELLLLVISVGKLLVEEVIDDLSSDFFTVVDIVFDFGLVVKSKKHPEMFTFVHDF